MKIGSRLFVLKLLLSATLVAPQVQAQDQDSALQEARKQGGVFAETQRTSRTEAFEQRPPFGGVSLYAYLSRAWSVNSFYTVFRGQGAEQTWFWVVKRISWAPGGTRTVVWADSRSCPAVESTLTAMENMPPVRPDVPRLGTESANLGLVLDGTRHVFWNSLARSGDNDATVALEIVGNVNSPVAQWWSAGEAALAECWSETAPS